MTIPTPPPHGTPAPGHAPGHSPAPAGPNPAAPYRPVRIPPPNPGVRTIIAIVGGAMGIGLLATASYGASKGSAIFPMSEFEGTFATDGISRLEIRTGEMDVDVVPYDGDTINWHANVSAFPGSTPSSQIASQSGETLVFSFERDGTDWGPWLRFGSNQNTQTLAIEVPADLVPDLYLDAGVGTTSVSGEFGDVTVDGGVGDLTVVGMSDSLHLMVGVGDLLADMGVDGGPLTIDAGVGNSRIDLGDAVAPSSIQVSSGVGDLTLLLPTTTLGYQVSVNAGLGGVTNGAPAAAPDGGVPSPVQIPVTIDGGVGSVTLGPTAH